MTDVHSTLVITLSINELNSSVEVVGRIKESMIQLYAICKRHTLD